MKNLINWKIFFILLIVCVIASLMVIPYSLALTSSEVEITPIILLLTVAQNLVLFAVAIFLGLLLSKQIGMGLPFFFFFLDGNAQTKGFKFMIVPSAGLGILTGLLLVLISIVFDKFISELQSLEIATPAAWKGFLASFYGGIGEEVLLRLFLVSLFVWLTFKIKKTKDGLPTDFGTWLSIILAAIVFGLGHLPVASQIMPLTGLVVVRTIVLNGLAGIVFGWLYWKKGLESAMIAHFLADIFLHVITPFVISFFNL
jgi:membrane protease YdiL (CAAX protease family)